MRIKITIGKTEVFARLNGSRTAKLIEESLPIKSAAELWGEEVYFYIKPEMGVEKEVASDMSAIGDVAYWPEGPCMVVFFGRMKPASTVNVFGKLEASAEVLRKVCAHDPIKVEAA